MKFNNGASYLNKEDWDKTSVYLDMLKPILEPIAKKFNLNVRCGSRWPYIELYEQSFKNLNSFRVLLGEELLENNEIVFHLVHQLFTRNILLKMKVVNSEKLNTYDVENFSDLKKISSDIEQWLNKKMI